MIKKVFLSLLTNYKIAWAMLAWPAGGLDISLKKKSNVFNVFNVMTFAMTIFRTLNKCILTNVSPHFHSNKISCRKKLWCTSVMSHYKCSSFTNEICMKLRNKDITPGVVFDVDMNSNSMLMKLSSLLPLFDTFMQSQYFGFSEKVPKMSVYVCVCVCASVEGKGEGEVMIFSRGESRAGLGDSAITMLSADQEMSWWFLATRDFLIPGIWESNWSSGPSLSHIQLL